MPHKLLPTLDYSRHARWLQRSTGCAHALAVCDAAGTPGWSSPDDAALGAWLVALNASGFAWPCDGEGMQRHTTGDDTLLYSPIMARGGRIGYLAVRVAPLTDAAPFAWDALAEALEDIASAIADECRGYRLTTTINNVTSESIEFLDTGVILRVTPSVDADGRIMMKIRPEVSSGSVSAGIPSKKTTEVNTQLVASDGQPVLIGGLIKRSRTYRRLGIPLLSDIPLIGGAFASTDDGGAATETIVVITPRIVPAGGAAIDNVSERTLQQAEQAMRSRSDMLDRKLDTIDP